MKFTVYIAIFFKAMYLNYKSMHIFALQKCVFALFTNMQCKWFIPMSQWAESLYEGAFISSYIHSYLRYNVSKKDEEIFKL